jgi:hypothetical protein
MSIAIIAGMNGKPENKFVAARRHQDHGRNRPDDVANHQYNRDDAPRETSPY